ncbi:MAG: hypothetical protein ACLT40_07715 [Fusobacterium sp.]
MNIQTKKKIEEIKGMIKKKTKLEDIIKEKFVTVKKKDSWLDKNHEHFTERELKYLNFAFSPEIIEAEEVIETTPKAVKIDETEITEAVIEEPKEVEEQAENPVPEEKKATPVSATPSNNIDFFLDSPKIFKSFEEIKTPQDKINFLLNDKVLKALFFMTEGQAIKNEADATLKYSLENIKTKYSQNIKIKNIRINEDLYKHFTEFCEENKITIISALSCALEEFLEKYKELDKKN